MTTEPDISPEAAGFIQYAAKAFAAMLIPWLVSLLDTVGDAIGVEIPIDVNAATAVTISIISALAVYFIRNAAALRSRALSGVGVAVAALVVAGGLFVAVVVPSGDAEAHKITPRVIVGELQSGPFNVSPPTALDVAMVQGWYGGLWITTRCANMGGHLGGEYLPWLGRWGYVCYHVDY